MDPSLAPLTPSQTPPNRVSGHPVWRGWEGVGRGSGRCPERRLETSIRTPSGHPILTLDPLSGHRPDTVRTGDPGSGIEHPGATSREGPRSAPNSEFPEFKLARFGRFQGGNPLSRVGGIGQVWRSWLARDRPSWRRPGRAPDRAPGPSKPGSGIGGSGP